MAAQRSVGKAQAKPTGEAVGQLRQATRSKLRQRGPSRKKKRGTAWIAWIAAAFFLAGGGYALRYLVMSGNTAGPANTKRREVAAGEQLSLKGIALTIAEPVGASRELEPVTSGVPLPKSRVFDPTKLSLTNEKGQTVPCQFTPLCRWGDGSVKWVLLDFQANVPAKGKTSYRLRTRGFSPSPEKPVTVLELDSLVVVDTGRLKYKVNKSSACLIDSVELDEKEVVAPGKPIQVVMINVDGKVYRASKPTNVAVESRGPMRATVLVQGEFTGEDGGTIFDGKIGYDLRITAWAGKPELRLAFTLKNGGFYGYRNERKPRQWLNFKSLRIDVPVVSSRQTTGVARACNKAYPVDGSKCVSLVQWFKYPARDGQGFIDEVFPEEQRREHAAGQKAKSKGWYYCLEKSGNVLEYGEKAESWAGLSRGDGLHVGAAIRRFRQNFPRGFEVGPSRLSFLLWPEEGFWPRTKKAYEASTYQFEGGRHKTANLLLWFSARERLSDEKSEAFDFPLIARAPTEWYRDTGAVWPLAPADLTAEGKELAEALGRCDRLQRAKVDVDAGDPAGEKIPGWGDDWKKVSIPSLQERCPETFCGWMNFGDLVWSFGYCSLYYDWPYSMLLQHLRLGDRQLWEVGDDMVRHRYDIDQYHVGNTATYLGLFQRYERGAHGHLVRQEKVKGRHKWEGNARPSHTWNRGLLLHWALTGDQRSFDVAVDNGQAFHNFFYKRCKLGEKKSLVYKEFRSVAWAIENWLALYEYTGERKYLDWSTEIFTKTLLAMEKSNGSCGHILEGGRQGAQFTAYMIEPLCRLHHLTGRQGIAEFLKRVLDWERKAALRGGVTKEGRYHPVTFVEHWALADSGDPLGAVICYDFMFADGYAYLHQLYKRERDWELAQQLFRDSLFYYGTGKSCLPEDRTPLGYHCFGRPFGPCAKVHAFSGRYLQLFLQAGHDSGSFVRKAVDQAAEKP